MNERTVIECVDSTEVARYARDRVIEIIHNTLGTKSTCSIALSGGATPQLLYTELSRSPIEWDRVQIYLVDERYVPPTDIASNEHMIREALVSRIALPANNFHPMYSPESLVQSAQKYSNQIATHVGRFDIIILGLGDDGHTASLFQVPYMYESMDMVLPIHNSPKPPAERLTLSYDTINNARNILFLVTGASKSDVLFRVIDNDSTLPATHIYPKDGTLTIVHATTDQ